MAIATNTPAIAEIDTLLGSGLFGRDVVVTGGNQADTRSDGSEPDGNGFPDVAAEVELNGTGYSAKDGGDAGQCGFPGFHIGVVLLFTEHPINGAPDGDRQPVTPTRLKTTPSLW